MKCTWPLGGIYECIRQTRTRPLSTSFSVPRTITDILSVGICECLSITYRSLSYSNTSIELKYEILESGEVKCTKSAENWLANKRETESEKMMRQKPEKESLGNIEEEQKLNDFCFGKCLENHLISGSVCRCCLLAAPIRSKVEANVNSFIWSMHRFWAPKRHINLRTRSSLRFAPESSGCNAHCSQMHTL